MADEMKDGRLKVINESKEVTEEEVEKIQKAVDVAFNPTKKGNPVADKLNLEDGELDVRQLPLDDFKQVVARMNKNIADGFNALIDQQNYMILVLLESLAPSKKEEVLKRIDNIRIKGTQFPNQQ